MLGVFIALVAEIFCVNVAGSTLSGVVWETEKDEEMPEGADIIKGWLDEPTKSHDQKIKRKLYCNCQYCMSITKEKAQ